MSDPPITPEKFIETLKIEMDQLDNFFIRYHLRRMGIRDIRKATIERVKACYFLDKYGLWITSNILTAITEVGLQANLSALHSLGDKNIIILHGYEGKKLSWKLNPELKRMIEGKQNEEAIE